MGVQLVIAEKPSVAASIAKVIGAEEKRDGYLAGNGYLVSWCLGHLVELCEPQDYDPGYAKWRKEDLPIFPDPFRYRVMESTKGQFQKLKALMEREDVESLIEATDAGREGELIFRLVYQEAGCRKPFLRLWISSMEDRAIEEGFRNLKPSSDYHALCDAALCRERADWLVGINATRLFSSLYHQTLNVGRVMTPTLSMIAEREEEIRKFVSEPVYSVRITAGAVQAESEKTKNRAEAEALLSGIQADGSATVTKMEETEKLEKPPLLYDLTSLQRDANRLYGLTAQQTLDIAQSLYEKKLATYPRTDSRYLTEEMDDSTKRLACLVKEKWGYTEILPLHTERVINSSKVSDHHAILPTENVCDVNYGSLPEGERRILSLLSARLLAALGEPCRYHEYHLELSCAGAAFRAQARTVMDPGWTKVQGWILGDGALQEESQENSEGETGKSRIPEALAADPAFFREGRRFAVSDPEIREGKTRPKQRYTESTLLTAMERAGAKETPEEAERKGLGTPATRAGIIEKLVRIGFVERKGDRKTKYLVPTEKGSALVSVMPDVIRSPLLTAEWEQKLLDVEKRRTDPGDFLQGIREMISNLVKTYEPVRETAARMRPQGSLGTCPACGADLLERQKGYFCTNRDCRFALWKENRYFDSIGKKMTRQIAESLIRTGKASLTKCRSQKTGKTFDTTLMMSVGEDGEASFSLDFPKRKKGAK